MNREEVVSFFSQLGNGPEYPNKNSARMDFNESPINYDFFGGQQQIGSQHPGMLQPLPRQQSGISDMQLLQQQFIMKQMQEMQRQQQLQKQQLHQQEARQLNSMNQISAFAKQAATNHPQALINGIPIQDAPNYSWQPELFAANTNWQQRGPSLAMQGSFGGNMFSPEQGQAQRLMSMAPQQVDQSLYGVPISGTRGTPSQYSPIQMDKPSIQQISGSSNSLPSSQFTGFPDREYQGKFMTGSADGQDTNNGFNFENLQQVHPHQNNGPVQEFSARQELAGPLETSQEKTAIQVAPSQNVATLDPTEAKILFGSDDNLWDAFGRGENLGSGSYNLLDGADFFGALPSVQSGSWSALMQSAVAETSSGDTGLQEEWSGLTFRNNEASAGNQQAPIVNESSKQQSTWAYNSLQSASSMNSGPFSRPHETNTGVNYNIPVVPQSGFNSLHEHSERMLSGSPHRHSQQFSGDGIKRSDRSLLQKAAAEGSHVLGKATRSSDAESNAKIIPGSWANQQSIPSCNSSGHPLSGPSSWNFMDSVSPSATAASNNQGNENSFRAPQNADKENPMIDVIGHGAGIWKTSSASNSVGELEGPKPVNGSPQVNREDTNLNNIAALPNSSTVSHQESSLQLPKSDSIDIWKHAGSSVNHKGNEIPGNYQPNMVKNDQTFELSGNNSLADSLAESHEIQKSNIQENTTDNFPGMSHHSSTMGMRENVWSGASDSCSLPSGKHKPSSHIGRKPSGIRKFQYHPMGDLDVDKERSHGTQEVTPSQSIIQPVSQGLKGYDRGYIGQADFPSHASRNSVEIEKGHLSGFQGETKGFDEVSSKTMLPGSAHSMSSSLDRSVNAPDKTTTSSSQNMLELLHKVDQSREQGKAMLFSSFNRNQSSEMPEAETSDSTFHLQKNQSSVSQGFGLQLAPPSQRLVIQESAFSSQSPSHTTTSLGSTQIPSITGEKGNTWLSPASSVQSLPLAGEISQALSRNNISGTSGQAGNSAQGKLAAAFSRGLPYLRSHPLNQHMTDTAVQATTSQSPNESFDRFSSQVKLTNESFERDQTGQSALESVPDVSRHTSYNDVTASAGMPQPSTNSQNHSRDSTQQFPVLEAAQTPQRYVTSQSGVSSKMSPSMWTSVPTQLRPFGAQPFQAPSNMFKPNLQSHNNSGISFSQPQKLEDQIMQTGGSCLAESSAYTRNLHGFAMKEQSAKGDLLQQVIPETKSASHEKESVTSHLSETSLSNLTSTQKDIEAFGRSLRPNNILHQNYSLLQQVQGMKNAEVDPGNLSLKRFRSPDGSVDGQQVAAHGEQQFFGHNNMVRDASANRISSEESKMLNFSAKLAHNHNTNAPSKDMLAFGRNDSQSFAGNSSAVSTSGENSQISPQMAPSWFDQYGAYKNGQLLPMHDARKTVTMKTAELPFTVGRPADGLHAHSLIEQGNAAFASGQFAIVQKSSSPLLIASENLSTPLSMRSDSADLNLVVMRPNKRKHAISEFMPWHKEVIQGPQRLRNISMAEVDWSVAANRLTEKVEDEVEMVDDGLPFIRSKRRLILTTQLMQMLLRPPPASILSADAISHYETTAYLVARSTLGDACSTLSCVGRETSVPSNSGEIPTEKIKTSDKISEQYFSKVMEDLISRAMKLENDLLRLDKRASVSDLRVECQDLERFSVINRFAKFHGRGQTDVAERSVSSDATANAQKSCLQRYVTALPMPRNLPDRVQCLSL